jgi:CHAT domain-containing protein/tetratricopeptide (TPR) repeat protein
MANSSSEFSPANPVFWELYQQGRYQEALEAAKEGLDYAREQLGENHPGLGILLNELGTTHSQLGNYAEAEQAFLQAIALLRTATGAFRGHHAGALSNLASLYHTRGDYPRALPLCKQAVEIMRVVVGEEAPEYAAVVNTLAAVHFMMGNYAQAEPLWKEALRIRRAALGENNPEYATILSNLGDLYRTMSDYPRAELMQRQALDIYRRALGERHPHLVPALNGLAEVYLYQNNCRAAEPLVRQAVLVSRLALGKDHPDHAASLHNLATLHLTLGDYAKAETLFRQALAIQRKVLGENQPDFAIRLNMLALCHWRMGDHAGAEPLLRQALEITRQAMGEEHPEYALRLDNLAQLHAAMGRIAEAFTLLQQVAAIDNRMIGQIFSIGSESQRLTYLAKIKADTDEFLSLVWKHLASSRTAIHAAFDLVLRRKALGAEAHGVQRAAVLGGRYPQLRPKLEELSALRMRIAQATLAGPRPREVDAHRRLLAEWNAEKERLEAALAHQIPEMNLETQLRAADHRAVALALPEGVALVEFIRFDVLDFNAVAQQVSESHWLPPRPWQSARYLAFVLPAGGDVQMIHLGDAAPIDQLIAEFRAGIIGEAGRPGGRNMVKRRPDPASAAREDSGRRLRAALFDKVAPALGGHRRLLLALDGDLTRLPFEVLPDDDGRLLIDTYQISYLGCGRDVLRFGAESTGQPAAALVVADPDFDLTARPGQASTQAATHRGRQSSDRGAGVLEWDRLNGTRAEGQTVAGMLGVQPWLGDQVLAARVKGCRSPRILHLATHGFFLADQERDPNQEGWVVGGGLGRLSGLRLDNPLLRSGLVLAGANTWHRHGNLPDEAENGHLTAEDISGLDLLDTELVVLSACETGLGEVHTGEGVFGLQRAFVLAGAKSLVMSLWSVPDEPTQELMEDFYRRILSSQPRTDALHEAQRTLRAKYPDPFCWGAFVCLGNPGLLGQPTPKPTP